MPAPVVAVLALYSFGMILAKVSGLCRIALFLFERLGRPYLALRKRLREFYLDAHAKSGVNRGQKRRDFDVSTCFAPLLRWILSLWQGRQLVECVGDCLYVEGRAYSGEDMPCTLLARYAEGYEEPWFILTDLPPEAADAVWYALRAWIEQGFEVIKGGGWDWEKTRMEDPERVERLWLVMAVATLWVVAVGAADEVREAAEEERKKAARGMSETLEEARKRLEREESRQRKQKEAQQRRRERKEKREKLKQEGREKTREKKASKQGSAAKASDEASGKDKAAAGAGEKTKSARKRVKKPEGARQRTHRVSARGLAVLSALWQNGQNALPELLHPEAWPEPSHSASTLTEDEFLAQQT